MSGWLLFPKCHVNVTALPGGSTAAVNRIKAFVGQTAFSTDTLTPTNEIKHLFSDVVHGFKSKNRFNRVFYQSYTKTWCIHKLFDRCVWKDLLKAIGKILTFYPFLYSYLSNNYSAPDLIGGGGRNTIITWSLIAVPIIHQSCKTRSWTLHKCRCRAKR